MTDPHPPPHAPPATPARSAGARDDFPWWSSLRHGGCLIAPSRLGEFFFTGMDGEFPPWLALRLRRDLARLEGAPDRAALEPLLDSVLIHVLKLPESGLPDSGWRKGAALGDEWTAKGMTGETLRPDRVWTDGRGGVLPVFVAVEKGKPTSDLGIGRGRHFIARTIQWLRGVPLPSPPAYALLTNGSRWRLIHAGPDFDAWCEWDVDAWFEEGRAALPLDALRILLGERSVGVASDRPPGARPRLAEAILATRRGQAELSAALGERVREAVELLLRASGSTLDEARRDPALAVGERDLYIAAVRLVMRLVVVLFAEERRISDADFLLPLANPVYHGSYSLRGLRDLLEREGGGRHDRLRDSHHAWHRLLALFRLVHEGSAHEALVVPAYGGGLFQGGDAASSDPVLRALHRLEHPENRVSDAVVAAILERLTKAPVKIRQGRAAQVVVAPVDFAQLDTEYIGILYEGLLDYELRRVEDGIPMLFLALGDQPALPLGRLEAMDDKALAELVAKLGKPDKAAKGGGDDAADDAEDADDEAEADDAEEDDAAEDDAMDVAEADESAYPAGLSLDALAPEVDSIHELRLRAADWARRAVAVGRLVKKPAGKLSDAKKREYDEAVEKMAARLVARRLLPGEYYLVRFGGTRKGSGTFYTKPALARPTVRRTLAPLTHEERPDAPPRPRTPAEILAIRVCDPACGSGSFLIASLRHLSDALFDSLIEHEWLLEGSSLPSDTASVGLHFGGQTGTGERVEFRWGPAEPKIPAWFREYLRDVPGIEERADLRRRPSGEDPDNDSAERKIRARLRRVVVERCIHGVDLDPLAVELARLSLWIETMDYRLPFSFLDHRIKCGNALVGCWFDRFADYPLLAWEREGGDKSHTTAVHFAKETWTKAIAKAKQSVKGEMAKVLEGGGQRDLFGFGDKDAARVHDDLAASFERMHERLFSASRHGHHDAVEEQAETYRREFLENPAVVALREAFDAWCAVWFWPADADRLALAPTPARFRDLGPETRALVARLREELRFFHWELEFPDVFTGAGTGFSAIVGNPPWEVQKPNSKEWFSNEDPLYRAYGKQAALARQRELFDADPAVERRWLETNARLKGLSNWTKNAGHPFGDPDAAGTPCSLARGGKGGKGGENARLHGLWRDARRDRKGYSDPEHPFLHQGSADINTYKMFLELGHALLGAEGRMGFIVPSGLYTDRGASDLRALFLDRCRWEWLFGFENRDKVFDIDSRFKFCPVIVRKGGRTGSIRAAFMVRDVTAWEVAERHALDYPADRIARFSPKSRAILEIRSPKDLAILEKMYAGGVLLGDDGPDGWGIRYAREFDMTNDSKLFPRARSGRPTVIGRTSTGTG